MASLIELAQLTDRLELWLKDAGNAVWTALDLNEFIGSAMKEYSMAVPLKQTTILRSQKRVHDVDWVDDTNEVTTTDATTLATAITLLEAIRTAYHTGHIASTVFHTTADTTNTIAAATATDQASAITLAKELKNDINAHMIESRFVTGNVYHPMPDWTNQITMSDAYDTGTTALSVQMIVDLANEIKARYNAHLDQKVDGRDVDINSITSTVRFIGIDEVEYPMGKWPRQFVGYDRSGDLLHMHSGFPPMESDEPIGIHWNKEHLLHDYEGATAATALTTFEEGHEDLILHGAMGYALLQAKVDYTGAVSLGETETFRRIGQDKLAEFKARLAKLKLSHKKPKNLKQAVWK